ncbi:heavy metal translocating P-type ATPase [Fusobacterium ulcerans]|uniref:P-type Cu(+) transporter n=1 Tax=Fusobacterium ulcerans TaxID=861 RepID=A0AAX2JBJ9_9FUSO|nr:cation-translocating P-type ATPase [Fusobacterium ulcerans]AVQ26663.1 heavy metal translocating P-type ATPase [Fusobacterium ulcerans]EFS25219.1 heavy metal translocating P-type ATPase [Fusobacterium ulcerans ATCC 49185]SQJ06789.1 Copper-exporting P-type ATPase A [Fusobacterium ulcerans]
MEKAEEFLSSIPMTIIGGIFLGISLVCMLMGIELPVNPAWVPIIISGIPILYGALTALFCEKTISSELLVSTAIVASVAIGEIFAAGEIAFIMAIGEILEDITVNRAKKGISQLIKLSPQQGRKIIKENEKTTEKIVPIEEIYKDDILRVLPGEMIPVDGKIIFGNSSVDQSIMTGESLPIDKTIGDEVFCGTVNCDGSIDIIATKIGEDSSLQKLIRMVKEAEENKAPMQRIVDKWAGWLVPAALIIAVAAYFITSDIIRAVTVLVVFCPCALALATPTSIMAAVGQAAKNGVLIKSGEALEKMGKVNCIAFDKTGTLTFGKLKISDIITTSSATENELLKLACSSEKRSEHPLGKAIVEHGKKQNVEFLEMEDFKMIPGKGIAAKIENNEIYCGNSRFLQEQGIILDENIESILENLRKQGKVSILVGKNRECIGVIALSDTIRPTAKEIVVKLKNMGTRVVLLTGDHKQTADYFAEEVGIENVYSELLPAEKVTYIKKLEEDGNKVCMIGDGVNDAPALKTADVGVSMASMGTDIAVEASDIALMGDNIEKIPYLKKLSTATIKTIKFNITASMVINLAAIILSVMGLLNPITGALVHNVGSVLVVLNAALLYDRKFA